MYLAIAEHSNGDRFALGQQCLRFANFVRINCFHDQKFLDIRIALLLFLVDDEANGLQKFDGTFAWGNVFLKK
jgi:hypothetical protein